MGHSEVKEPTTLVISHTISVATMDFLKPISSSAYVTIPVATRNKNLTKRNLGYDRIQLVIKSVLLCFGSALLITTAEIEMNIVLQLCVVILVSTIWP